MGFKTHRPSCLLLLPLNECIISVGSTQVEAPTGTQSARKNHRGRGTVHGHYTRGDHPRQYTGPRDYHRKWTSMRPRSWVLSRNLSCGSTFCRAHHKLILRPARICLSILKGHLILAVSCHSMRPVRPPNVSTTLRLHIYRGSAERAGTPYAVPI